MAKAAGASGNRGRSRRRRRTFGLGADLTGSFVISYLVGLGLIAALVYFAGVWNILSYTRLLDVLVDGGIVPLTDADAGYGQGVPELGLYVGSQEAVNWEIVVLTVGFFVVLAVVKAWQFHRIAHAVGLFGRFGQHARAYVYSHGVNRMLPFRVGDVAAASALRGQGAPPDKAASVVYVARLALVFEVVFFAFVSLYYVGLTSLAVQLAWPLLILLAAYLLTHPSLRGAVSFRRDSLRLAARTIRGLARQPLVLTEIALLSVFAFLLVDTAAYFIPQAFSGEIVVLHATGSQILVAVVGGYIARLVPFSPGGIGQFEWGFTLALVTSGLAFPDAAAIALLLSAVRYLTGGLIFAGVMLAYGVETDFRHVTSLLRKSSPQPQGAA